MRNTRRETDREGERNGWNGERKRKTKSRGEREKRKRERKESDSDEEGGRDI